jgi:hypothetical protein
MKSGGPSVGKVGECDVVRQHLQDYSPRLCQLMTDELAPTSKYWMYWSHASDMNPVILVAWHQQRMALPPLLQWLAQERNWVRTRESVSRHVVDCVGSLFLRSSGSVHHCWWFHERLLYVDHVRHIWSRAICGPSVESVWRVGQVFPYRVYIDSNRRDSRIWVTAYSW